MTSQVTQAAHALESAQEALKTIHHLIDQKNWWHEQHIRRPVMYVHGPIEGTKRELARWIFPELKDPRCLENANRKPGILWVVKLPENKPQNRFQVWLISNSMFQDAQTRKIADLKRH